MSDQNKNQLSAGRRVGNPLLKRIPKELVGEWRKYLVIFLFLTLTIGFVAGMYVANHSMLTSFEEGKTRYKLEDGHFELADQADEELLAAIASGEKIDLRAYYIEEAYREIDEKLEEEVQKEAEAQLQEELDQQVNAKLEEVLEEARKTAYEEARNEINKKFDEQEEKKTAAQKKQDAAFVPVEVALFENFYKDTTEDNDLDGDSDGKIRLFTMRDDSNLACLMEGALPADENEIVIDRMHADNSKLTVGDVIRVGGKEYTISGLVALVNYSTLYEHNTDIMFDALTFNVAWVTEEGFERIAARTHYCYAWNYVKEPADERKEKEASDFFMAALVTQTMKAENDLEDYVPRYANQAIQFAPEDMGSDKTMGGALLYILVAVLAFIFAITVNSTITKEASVIGTLRASGYTKGELTAHYMAMPVLVTLAAAVVGNILGYTYFKNVVVAMYYNSYSLPTYETVWYYEAFVKTTIVPVVLMLVINYFVIRRQLMHTPLQFLRHDLKTSKRKKAMRLPKVKFLSRFRMRVMIQNMPNYVVLFFGMFFVMLLLGFAFGLPSTLKHYQENAVEQMFAKYQYVLKQTEDEDGKEIVTAVSDAEKYSMTTLLTTTGIRVGESVSVYGLESGSNYVRLEMEPAEGEVMISSAYADKFGLKRGDRLVFSEKYTGEEYDFTVAGVYDYMGGVAIFMPLNMFNRVFDRPADSYNGYLSNEELTDIPEKYIATTVTEEDITRVSRQLDHSMGGYMNYFKVACLIFAVILIYLLTKVIIERNENAISMVKILGYENGEIASLYLMSTTWVVLFSAVVGAFLGIKGLEVIWMQVMKDLDGWLPVYIGPMSYVGMIVLVFAAYLVILFIDYRRIKRIPMDEALKNVE